MEDLIKRIKNAIIILNDGHPFKVEELYLSLNNGLLNITGESQSTDLKNVTPNSALMELGEIKSIFNAMISNSVDLQNFVVNKSLKFNLDFNYGMGSIRICNEMDGVVKWEYKIAD